MKHLSIKQKKLIYIASIAFFILLMIWLSAVVGKPLIQYARDPQKFVAWIDSFGIWSRLIFIAIVALQVVVAIIPGGPFEVAAGYAFGIWEGTLLTAIAVTVGCYICFVLVRSVSHDFAEVFFSDKDLNSISFLKDTEKLKRFAFILNLIPGVPKDLLSYFAGLTNIPLGSWLIAVFSGRLPAIVVSCLSGTLLSDGNIWMTAAIFLFFALCSLLGLKIYDNLKKKHNRNKTEKEAE